MPPERPRRLRVRRTLTFSIGSFALRRRSATPVARDWCDAARAARLGRWICSSMRARRTSKPCAARCLILTLMIRRGSNASARHTSSGYRSAMGCASVLSSETVSKLQPATCRQVPVRDARRLESRLLGSPDAGLVTAHPGRAEGCISFGNLDGAVGVATSV